MARRKKTTSTSKVSSSKLTKYFPMIRTKEEIRKIIRSRTDLNALFQSWDFSRQEEFLNFCSGNRGVKILYDGIFKEILNPESKPERLGSLLSQLLNRKILVKMVLPNDSVRLGAESSLLYTDIVVQLEDGSLANIEIQKLGYAFPGQRSACYSADLLLRQYKRIRGEKGKQFHYQDIKTVYTIVFFECSSSEFHRFPDQWLHIFQQQSNTGISLDLLQEYLFIPLDIFKENMENKPIETELEAWLTFLSSDDPDRIIELIQRYPRFKDMYQDIYDICLNMEKVMNMYSKELQELDHNTVMYMIDEMQAQVEQKAKQVEDLNQQLKQREQQFEQLEQLIKQQEQLTKQQEMLLKQQEMQFKQQLEQRDQQLKQLTSRIQSLQEQLSV